MRPVRAGVTVDRGWGRMPGAGVNLTTRGRAVVTTLVILIVAYAAVCLAAWGLQRRFMYFPGPALPPPASAGLADARIIRSESMSSRTRLTHWYIPSARPGAPVIAHFHGNAGSIADRAFVARAWAAAGYGVLLAEYPGYGGNPGAPTETSLYDAGRAVLAALGDEGLPPRRWILVGESLGAGVAVRLAQEQADRGLPVGAVILEAPFTATADVARRVYWFLPMRWLIRDRFPLRDRIAGIGAPLLIVHGGRDGIVPQRHGRALFAAAREPKQGAWIERADHNDLHAHGAFDAEFAFVRQLFPKDFKYEL
jgi:fermentation-respiration switch protein FrsA (DUF1100 family)